jgi:hypothetical protein
MTCPTPSSLPMVATSRYESDRRLPLDCLLTQSGRVRREGGRERRYSGRHTVQRWRGAGSREARHQQAPQARREQEDSNGGPEYGHCMEPLNCSTPAPANRHPRSPQVCSPTVATLPQELVTRRPSGGNCTKHPSPLLHSPNAWAATRKHTLSTPVCGPLA